MGLLILIHKAMAAECTASVGKGGQGAENAVY